MKYLNSYKLFESIDSDEIIGNIEDIFLDLRDSGFEICVEYSAGIDQFYYSIWPEGQSFLFSEVIDYINRVDNYLSTCGYKIGENHGDSSISFPWGRIHEYGTSIFTGNILKFKDVSNEVTSINVRYNKDKIKKKFFDFKNWFK